jgi:hypothetical protein
MGTERLVRSWLALCVSVVGAACSADDAKEGMRPLAQAGSSGAATSGTPGSAVAGRSSIGAAGSGVTPGVAGATAAPGGSPAQQPPVNRPPPATGGAGTPAPAMPAAGSGMPATPPPPPGPPGTWPAGDPAKLGPFATVTEMNVGPGMAFTMFRPMMLTQRHPVITWGNGTSTTPMTYRTMLNLYASHGFIVIASNSMNVAQGTPPPMLDGVTWVLEQDMTQGSALFGHVDRDHIGATGHSQGAIATSTAAADPRIKTIAPIEVLRRGTQNGPVLALCGAMDTTLPCSGNMTAFNSVANQPAMYAELKTADHMNWIYSPGAFNPFWVITTAWFRVHLMNDTALRPMFYGECSLCKDTATWVTMRKMMDQ